MGSPVRSVLTMHSSVPRTGPSGEPAHPPIDPNHDPCAPGTGHLPPRTSRGALFGDRPPPELFAAILRSNRTTLMRVLPNESVPFSSTGGALLVLSVCVLLTLGGR